MSLVAVGLTHHTAPLDVLEQATIDDDGLTKALTDLVSRDHVAEVVVLSTCNRIEIYAMAERFHGAVDDICSFLCDRTGLSSDGLSDIVALHYDDGATRHLFEVASGLDSAVIGEHEVLGQVRRAWERGQAEGTSGSHLNTVFRHALEVGKAVRTETSIGRHTTSVSQAAVQMAAHQLGSLDGCKVLVLGAGEMGGGIAQALHSSSVGDVAVVNRTWERAVELAEAIGGRAVPLLDLPVALGDVDLLLTTTGARSIMVEHGDLEPVMRAREDRSLLIVDVAVPRDVDPGAADLPGVTLLDMDDLRAFAEQGIEQRTQEISKVNEMIELAVLRWSDEHSARRAAPLVTALRTMAEDVRESELARFAPRLEGLDDRQREAVEALTRGIVGKLLHEPTVRVKDAVGSARGERLAEAMRDLFDLDDSEPPAVSRVED
ncbi:MAG TPA: glutamyl-tRNA reductase [Acidimicrobiales bacterium]|jgi:glutamyl-tRNA reductase